MRRWRERLEKHGYDGLTDRRKGKRSQRRVAVKTCEEVLRLYQERYFDLSVRHFHEKLKAEHAIELSYTWVKQALQGAGLVERRRRRGPGWDGVRVVSAPARLPGCVRTTRTSTNGPPRARRCVRFPQRP